MPLTEQRQTITVTRTMPRRTIRSTGVVKIRIPKTSTRKGYLKPFITADLALGSSRSNMGHEGISSKGYFA